MGVLENFTRRIIAWPAAAVLYSVALLAFVMPAKATTNFVSNGSFESTSSGGNGGEVNGEGQIGYNINVADWTVGGTSSTSYFFLFNLPAADTTPGTTGVDGSLALWGPNDGSSNGLTASPDGGNFVGSDPDYQNQAISQTITGLTATQQYDVTFYWAAAQQEGFTGATTGLGWQVSLGSQTLSTTTTSNTSEGFNGWFQSTLVFTATSGSELLSFLSVGNGTAALPPFVLLDGVSLTSATPEPGSWAMILGGLGLLAGGRVFRSRNSRRAARDE